MYPSKADSTCWRHDLGRLVVNGTQDRAVAIMFSWGPWLVANAWAARPMDAGYFSMAGGSVLGQGTG